MSDDLPSQAYFRINNMIDRVAYWDERTSTNVNFAEALYEQDIHHLPITVTYRNGKIETVQMHEPDNNNLPFVFDE